MLVLACSSVAGLQVFRAARQDRAIAIQLAIGASRAGLMRASLYESGVIACAGACGAVAVAWAPTRALVAMARRMSGARSRKRLTTGRPGGRGVAGRGHRRVHRTLARPVREPRRCRADPHVRCADGHAPSRALPATDCGRVASHRGSCLADGRRLVHEKRAAAGSNAAGLRYRRPRLHQSSAVHQHPGRLDQFFETLQDRGRRCLMFAAPAPSPCGRSADPLVTLAPGDERAGGPWPGRPLEEEPTGESRGGDAGLLRRGRVAPVGGP